MATKRVTPEDLLEQTTRTPNAKPKATRRRTVTDAHEEREEIEKLIKGLIPLHPLYHPPSEVPEEDEIDYGSSQGKPGKKAHRQPIAFSTKNKRFLDAECEQRNLSRSAIINILLDVAREESEKLTIKDDEK